MHLKRNLLLIFLIMILSLIIAIVLQRHLALQDPTSCLSKKQQILEMQKKQPKVIGWSVPHCNIFGHWRAQQENEGSRWCVTSRGEMIPGTLSSENPKQCYLNFIQKIYVVLMDAF